MAQDGQNRGMAAIQQEKICFFCVKNSIAWQACAYTHPEWVNDPKYKGYLSKSYVLCSRCVNRPKEELVAIIVENAKREVATAAGGEDLKRYLETMVIDPDLKMAIEQQEAQKRVKSATPRKSRPGWWKKKK